MSPDQLNAFQANGGFTPSLLATVLLSAVFAVLLVWGVWAMRTAYAGWAERRLSQQQLVGVVLRFTALYLVLTFFCCLNARISP